MTRRRFIFCCILFLLVLPRTAPAEGLAAEYAVKAAFLYNFAVFTAWPEQHAADGPFIIGILGRDPFGDSFGQFREKGVKGRKLVVQQVSSAEEALRCHILFISRSEKKNLRHLLGVLRQHPVLTVSEIDGFTSAGGMIGLYLLGERVRFEVNREAAEGTGLKISSQVLKLATPEERRR